jgi:hypothetical protein
MKALCHTIGIFCIFLVTTFTKGQDSTVQTDSLNSSTAPATLYATNTVAVTIGTDANPQAALARAQIIYQEIGGNAAERDADLQNRARLLTEELRRLATSSTTQPAERIAEQMPVVPRALFKPAPPQPTIGTKASPALVSPMISAGARKLVSVQLIRQLQTDLQSTGIKIQQSLYGVSGGRVALSPDDAKLFEQLWQILHPNELVGG